MFKYYFLQEDNLPPNIGFSLYDHNHLSYLIVIFLSICILCIKYKNTPKNKKTTFKKILCSIMMFGELYTNIVLIVTKQFKIQYLPFHLCSIAIFIYVYDAFKPNNITKEFIYSICMPGAFMALVFPNWTVYPIFNFLCINSFVIHGILMAYPILLLHSGELHPNIKNLPKCFLYLITLSIPIYFFNKIFDTNFMFLNTPSEGSPLITFEKWFGTPYYIFGILIILLIVWFMLYIPYILKQLHIYAEKNLINS